MSFSIETPKEIMQQITERMKAKRLLLNLTQEGLALRAGVSIGTIKHFEKSGKVSFETLLNLAMALGCLNEFDTLFAPSDKPITLFEEFEPEQRKRGRIK